MQTLDELRQSAKGPFKGKGQAQPIPSLRAARVALAQERDHLERAVAGMRALAREAEAYFTTPPARIVHQPGRGYIWRLRAASPNRQYQFTFADDRGKIMLQSLPIAARDTMRRFDQRRAWLNLEIRLASYRCRALKVWIGYCEEVGFGNGK